MSITPLSVTRIAGEVGLAGGTITGGTYAAQYANKVVSVEKQKDAVVKDKEKFEQAAKNAVEERDAAVERAGTTSSTVNDTVLTQYLINDYFLQKHRGATEAINVQLQKLNLCLYGHLVANDGDNCKKERTEMKDTLNSLGHRFTH